MESIEIPPQTDVEIRLNLIMASAELAIATGMTHDQALSHAHLWHEWVDPGGVDNVEVLRMDHG